VVSFCGTSTTFPNISLEEAWQNLIFGLTKRIASSRRVTPTAVTSAVNVGWFQEAVTKDCAARLYTSLGSYSSMMESNEPWSVRSP